MMTHGKSKALRYRHSNGFAEEINPEVKHLSHNNRNTHCMHDATLRLCMLYIVVREISAACEPEKN